MNKKILACVIIFLTSSVAQAESEWDMPFDGMHFNEEYIENFAPDSNDSELDNDIYNNYDRDESYISDEGDDDVEDSDEDSDEEPLTKENNKNFSTQDSQTHLDAEPTAIVNGSVNVISGRFQDFETDFVIPGAEPFAMQRCYISGNTGKYSPLGQGWCRNYFGVMNRWKETTKEENVEVMNPHRAAVMESFGAFHIYWTTNKYDFKMVPETYESSATNCGSGLISGRSNIKNNHLNYTKNSKIGELRKGSGGLLKFTKFQDDKLYYLTHETRPSGNLLTYSYSEEYDQKDICIYNRYRKFLRVIGFSYKEVSDTQRLIFVKTPNAFMAQYRLEEFKGKKSKKSFYLVESIRADAPKVTYAYETHLDDALAVKMIRKNYPNNRFQEIQYYKKHQNDVGGTSVYVKNNNDPRIERVMLQKAPVGTDATPIVTHRYFYEGEKKSRKKGEYDLINGYAKVFDAHNHLMVYKWNEDLRLKSITRYTGKDHHQIYSKDRMYWGNKEGKDCTCLLSRTFENKDGEIQFIRSFSYDQSGNILTDTLRGNLSGWNQILPAIESSGTPIDNGCEKYVKTFTYSGDHSNLVTSFTEGDNKELYTYREGTDLLMRKLFLYKNNIYKREFYDYNADAVLVREIEDDGTTTEMGNLSGITERRIRYISPYMAGDIGLPHILSEKYLDLDTGEEKLFKKTIFFYCIRGRIIRKDIYNSENTLAYSLYWEYDDKGNVTKTIDSMGRIITRLYDQNNNLIHERGPHKKRYRKFHYDYSNRLIRSEEVINGEVLAESFKYDYLSNKIASIDIHGNETKYVYDEFGRLIKTIMPSKGANQPVNAHLEQYKEYTELGYTSKIKDPHGWSTSIKSNIFGKPYCITYPDGSQELFEYNLDGTLNKHTEKNGSYHRYIYDGLKRQINKRTYAPSGKLLSSNGCKYTTFQLKVETDPAGHITKHSYDGCGRLIKKQKGDSVTKYAYDVLGRLYKTKEYDGSGDWTARIQYFDLLDRVIEERTEDSKGIELTKVTYEYDADGNRSKVINYTEQGPAVTTTYYDNHSLPRKVVDPDGNVTIIHTDYHYKISETNFGVYCEMTDPLGNKIETTKDVYGKVILVVRKNAMGKIQQRQTISYDKNGNKRLQSDAVFNSGNTEKNIAVLWRYDSMNRLTETIEAAFDPEKKCTKFIYNKVGQKIATIKPDGKRISYTYDSLGRLSTYFCNDSFDYHYEYDANSNPVRIKEKVSGDCSLMEYDKNDRLRKETLTNGLVVGYTYDALRRPTMITLPDKSRVKYVYNANRLVEVHRLLSSKKTLYSHTYNYSSYGNKILSKDLIKNAGCVKYEYDILGRPTQIVSEAWSELITSYDKVGNLLKRNIQDFASEKDYEYSYDDLYQLTSESGDANHTYVNDSLFNRRKKDEDKLTLNRLNQLLEDGKHHYKYDRNGNLIEKSCGLEKESYKYDGLDRLVTVNQSNQIVRYRYDSLNRRLSKTIQEKVSENKLKGNAVTTNYLYLGQNEVGSYDEEGRAIELRVLGLGQGAEIGAAISVEIKGKVYAPLHDHNGNVAALIDAETGKTEEIYRYTAFGEELLFDGTGNPLSTSNNPWRFSSKRIDRETGFIYFGRRYYEPSIGRWVTPDPIGFEGGPNLYSYVSNGPLTHFDLYGLFGIGNFSFANCLEIGQQLAVNVINGAGQCLEFIGYNLVPIPIVRDILMLPGHLLQGKRLQDYIPSYREKHSSFSDLGLKNHPDNTVILTNGVLTSSEEGEARAWEACVTSGGWNVVSINSATHGFMSDVCDWALQKLGIPTHSEKVAAKCMRYWIDKVGGPDSGHKFHLDPHSQGGQIMYNMKYYFSEKECNMFEFHTFGSAKIIGKEEFGDANNYISNCDVVPFLASPINYISAKMFQRDNVIFLPSNSYPLIDHFWDNPTYKKQFMKLMQDLRKTRGCNE